MNGQDEFAVMVPFYADVDLLRGALASVQRQTDPDWRCIVVDDGATDVGVGVLVAAFADPRFEYVKNEGNLGVAATFNRCFELAVQIGAALVVVLHADDELEPCYVATMRAAHAHRPEVACLAPRVTVIDAAGEVATPLPDMVKAALRPRRLGELRGERGLRILLRGQFFYCPAVSFRLAEIDRPAWDERWRQVMDLQLFATVLLDGGAIGLETARVYRYRRHAASVTQVNSVELLRTVEETELSRELALLARGRGWRRAARSARCRWTVRAQAMVCAATLLVGRRWRPARRAIALATRP